MTNETTKLTAIERYLFDLNGFIVLRGALSPDEIAACDARLDGLQDCAPGEWRGRVQGYSYTGAHEGANLQQIYEAGPEFARLIDHPSWIDKVLECLGTAEGDTFDSNHGPCFIDENFASIRGPGQAIGLHSGGDQRVTRCQFRYHDGRFHCGQINILMAFRDIGPGDGATMVIPGSHKSNVIHPEFAAAQMSENATSADGIAGAVEVHLKAGDAILFVDAIMHGSAARTNDGQRRMAVYRYGPSWGFFRHAYRPSEALLQTLTPRQRQIVMPHKPPLTPPEVSA